jgi:hypothetical protein
MLRLTESEFSSCTLRFSMHPRVLCEKTRLWSGVALILMRPFILMWSFIKSNEWSTSLIKFINIFKSWSCRKLVLSFVHHLQGTDFVQIYLLTIKSFHRSWRAWLLHCIIISWVLQISKLIRLMFLLLLHYLISSFGVPIGLHLTLVVGTSLLG